MDISFQALLAGCVARQMEHGPLVERAVFGAGCELVQGEYVGSVLTEQLCQFGDDAWLVRTADNQTPDVLGP
ncbi:hypothetical protein ARTSIC4J27_2080 [Pseudarthrobacter siccitolerans]|uniref:Uncharacterized protein n=1 Tax=Pseudarthrobacter siccitolerans TaxID=861266 RepID=A0A024H1R3_9MICC|nr:hypothetical protein ARTSIC4J27_2080 [Pseudarthrobacter siccitolerans]